MTKFKEYIIEKTNKKEFEEALSNDNILAGCEFEFYLTEGSYGENTEYREHLEELLDNARSEAERAESNIDDYEHALSNLNAEQVELEDKLNDIGSEIDELESKIDSYNDEISDIKDMITTLNDELLDTEDSSILAEIKVSIKDLFDDLKSIEKKHDDASDILAKRNYIHDDLKSDLERYENYIVHDELMDEYDPIPNSYSMPSYYELLDIIHGGMSRNEFDSTCIEWFDNRDIPWPEIDIDGYVEDSNGEGGITKSDVEDLDFPVKLTHGWDVKDDSSLGSGSGGVEIVTPPLKLSELVDTIEKVFKWIDDNGRTDDTCGFHVHMSINNGSELDPLKLILFAEEGLVYKNFADRIGNTYAKSIKSGHINAISPFTVDDIIKVAKGSKLDKDLNTSKYLGIHLIDLKKNHVEFRYMGGDDYHKKFKDVREVIANYAHWLSIAGDSNYKKKEYITKVARLTNYFNYIYLNKVVNHFMELLTFYNDYMGNHGWISRHGFVDKNKVKPLADKLIKPYKNELKSLPVPKDIKYPPLTKLMDKATVTSNKLFREIDEM